MTFYHGILLHYLVGRPFRSSPCVNADWGTIRKNKKPYLRVEGIVLPVPETVLMPFNLDQVPVIDNRDCQRHIRTTDI
jgi:hypothetical protein